MKEVVIVGGGPAGLSAALVLGRCRRDVVVIDSGAYRNADAREMHCFLTRDATPPGELRRLARAELARYPTVELLEAEVIDAANEVGGKLLTLAGGKTLMCRALLLATGILDVLPAIRGARELHGRRVLACPYCDGWEVRDQPLAAFSFGDDRGARFALTLKRWSDDVVLCTGGVPLELSPDIKLRFAVAGIGVDERPVAELAEDGDALVVRFADGASLRRAALFYHLGAKPRSDLAARLGADLDPSGGVEVDRLASTGLPGLWVAGDATRDALLAIVAAGEGAAAGLAINAWLTSTEP